MRAVAQIINDAFGTQLLYCFDNMIEPMDMSF